VVKLASPVKRALRPKLARALIGATASVVSPNWRILARYGSSPLEPVRTPGLRKARSMAQLEE
jgi:hypothetical protein